MVVRSFAHRLGFRAAAASMVVGSTMVAVASCGGGGSGHGAGGSSSNQESGNHSSAGGQTSTGNTSGSKSGSGSGTSAGSGTSTPSGTGSTSASGSTTGSSGTDGGVAQKSWDWNGVVGTGQSLSVGTPPQSGEAASTTQPYHNLMLQLGNLVAANEVEDASTPPPWDADIPGIKMVPLTEPIRPIGGGFPRPYPVNIWGETHHSAMANEITLLAKNDGASDYVTVHTVVGESGQGIVALVKEQDAGTFGPTGRAYAATLFEASHITALAKAAGKSYGISLIVMVHGETDATNADYGAQLQQLLSDYNTDLPAITGQTQKIPMYLSQQHAYPCFKGPPLGCNDTAAGGRPLANQFEWQLGVMYPGQFVCTGPSYQYPVNPDNDGIHLSATGYQMLGEKMAEVYHERAILGHDWQPLQPTANGVSRSGRVVTVHFNVPVPPLTWDTSLDAPLITAWANGNGFELWSGTTYVTITSVAISGNSVQITAASDLPASGLMVGYAMADQGAQMKVASKAVRWGRLRDSDTFTGSTTKKANPNYAVSFQLPVP